MGSIRLSTPARTDAGMTLVEILVAVAILGLMATAVSTDWRRTGRLRRLADIAATIHALVDAARLESLRSGRSVSIEVDGAGRLIAVPATRRRLVLPSDVLLSARLADLGGRPEIVMLADGSSTGGAIDVALADGSSTSVTVSWATGLAHDE